MSQPKPTILIALDGGHKEQQPWVETFRSRLPDWTIAHLGDPLDPKDVRYVAAWKAPHGALKDLTSLDAIFSLGAGVDHLFLDETLPPAPVVRVVDPDLRGRMTEWVVLHTLLHHRQMPRYARQQALKIWEDDPTQPAARDVRVGVMGLGVLGAHAATALKAIGFHVAGWSRTAKFLDGIKTYAGERELDAFLAHAQILVVLLPSTPATAGILDAALFGRLARDGHLGGPVLLNAGRGALQNEADILRCLDDGTLYAATLDVFQQEPLPQDSKLWSHPGVTLTPHNASVSNPAAITEFIAKQIEDFGRGEPLRHVVDRDRRY